MGLSLPSALSLKYGKSERVFLVIAPGRKRKPKNLNDSIKFDFPLALLPYRAATFSKFVSPTWNVFVSANSCSYLQPSKEQLHP